MARNIELLTEVRDLIEADQSKLNMNYWVSIPADTVEFNDGTTAKVSCGTTACIAGWAVQLNGDKLLVNEYSDFEGDKYLAEQCVARNGRVIDISHRAEKLLGLSNYEADVLFGGTNEVALPMLNTLINGESLDNWYGDDDDDD